MHDKVFKHALRQLLNLLLINHACMHGLYVSIDPADVWCKTDKKVGAKEPDDEAF